MIACWNGALLIGGMWLMALLAFVLGVLLYREMGR